MALKRINDLDLAGSVDGTESMELGTGERATLQMIADLAGSGAGGGISLVTEASAFTATPDDHAGRNRLVLAGGDVTFDDAEGYVAGQAFNLRTTDAIELIGDGVTLEPPAGGTLALDSAMAVTVIMTSGTTAIVIGQTVPA